MDLDLDYDLENRAPRAPRPTSAEVVKAGPKRRTARKRQEPATAPTLTLQWLWEKQRQLPQTATSSFRPDPDPGAPQHDTDDLHIGAKAGVSADHPPPGHRVHALHPDQCAQEHCAVSVPDRPDMAKHEAGQPHGPEVPDETTDSSGTPGPPTATACPGQDGGKSGAQGDRGGPDGAPLACPRAGPLAAEYQSPVLSMFLEVGLRTEAAQTTWRNLHLLARSAAWASGITIVMPMP